MAASTCLVSSARRRATSAVRWARLALAERLLGCVFFADVVEDEDDALDVAVIILDGCRTVGDGPCSSRPWP